MIWWDTSCVRNSNSGDRLQSPHRNLGSGLHPLARTSRLIHIVRSAISLIRSKLFRVSKPTTRLSVGKKKASRKLQAASSKQQVGSSFVPHSAGFPNRPGGRHACTCQSLPSVPRGQGPCLHTPRPTSTVQTHSKVSPKHLQTGPS